QLKAGRWPQGPGQIAIDASTARSKHFAPGDRIGAAVNGPIRYYRISGVVKLASVDSLGGATIAVFDVPTAQKLLHKEGQLDVIALQAKHGVTPAELKAQVAKVLPPTAAVHTGSGQAKANAKGTQELMKFSQYFLIAFGGVALCVGAFVIFNTLSITVAQRTREFATLRTLGASRRQVLRSVLLEGLVIGVLASLTGLVLGLGLAKGLGSLMAAL